MQEGDSLNIYLLSDELKSYKALTLDIRLIDFNGKLIKKESISSLVLPGNTSLRVNQQALTSLLTAEQRKNCFLTLTLKENARRVLAQEVYFFEPTKNLNLPQATISYKLKQADGKCELTLSSAQLAKDVFIQIPIQGARFSDNFFDLLPGETKKITITSPLINKQEKPQVSIKHIKETY